MNGKKTEENQVDSVILTLGYFDCLHVGHRALIARAQELASACGAEAAVFTFDRDPASVFRSTAGTVLTLDERIERIRKTGVRKVIVGAGTAEFLSQSPDDFLHWLDGRCKIVGYVCGKDFRFGKCAVGTAETLSAYAKETGKTVAVLDDVTVDGVRVSTSEIRRLLADGKVAEAKRLLVEPYSVRGVVFADRKVGRSIGFPTINLKIAPEKAKLKNAVYTGHILIDGIFYRAIVNYGARPTFGLGEMLAEAHIDGFSGDLYGREVTLYLDDFLRDIVRFDSAAALAAQLKKDIEAIR